ncbi:hypothetical protein F0231_14440 [Vibrio sp. RE86]|uniref:DUF6701 domain-containing protein n=1 Tax=Vibrio sp. RE86 TaxID=2607605 RepID=UPI001493AD97|nr:DUF6701 domain-containing protein [Vibrio sp. RE86]NOH80939.1 hypothetical protein [Vibrio sp. RE86]
MKLVLTLFLALFGLVANATTYDDARFEFGRVDSDDCKSDVCTITFNNHYRVEPVVFLMSTIDYDVLQASLASGNTANNMMGDYPSILNLTNVTQTEAQFQQRMVLDGFDNSHAMQDIYYLVAEPGWVTMDPDQPTQRIYVDRVTTDFYREGRTRQRRTKNNWFNVEYPRRFSARPIVFTEVQPNSHDTWASAALWFDRQRDEFWTAIERGEDLGAPPGSMEIGYLAVVPFSGTTGEGLAFNFDNATTAYDQNTGTNTLDHLIDACENNTVLTGLGTSDYGVIHRMQERNDFDDNRRNGGPGGDPDGGWTRLCERNMGEFTFTIEEPQNLDREHEATERTAFFAFELPSETVIPDYCDIFPQPAQSWKNGSELKFESYPSSTPYSYFIGGWSDQYVTDYLDTTERQDKLSIGFKSIEHNGDDSDSGNDFTCEHGRCKSSNRRIDTPENISPQFNKGDKLDLGHWNYASKCPSDDSEPLCRSEVDDDTGHIFVTIKSRLEELKVQGQSQSKKMYVFFEPKSGEYGLTIKKYETNSNVRSIFDQSGIYTFDEFKTNSSTEIELGENIVWKIKKELKFENPVDLISTQNADDFTIYGPKAKVSFKQMNSDFYGRILADEIKAENKLILHGAVTTNKLEMKNAQSSIVGQSQCFSPTPTPSIVTIEIEPNNYHLTCDNNTQLYVTPYDQDGLPMDDVDGETVTLNANGVQFSMGTFNSTEKRFEFDVSRTDGEFGDVSVTATVDGTTVTDTDTLSFVPYKFDIKDSNKSWGESGQNILPLTAGRTSIIDIRVLACDDGQSVSVNYDSDVAGTNATISTPPVGGHGSLTVTDMSFSNGSVQKVEVGFDNSGRLAVDIKDPDPNFDCSNINGNCPIEQGALQGQFIIEALPWKIAICDITGEDGESFTNPASSFLPSAKDFDVTYRPLVFATTDDECGYPIATNYAEDSGPLVVMKRLDYPNGGSEGNLSSLLEPANFSPGASTLTATYSWNEVGTLEFTTPVNYLGEQLEVTDTQLIGRFYPEFFELVNNTWGIPNNQPFIYMNQPFNSLSFDVEALNHNTEPVENYGNPNYMHTASFTVQEIPLPGGVDYGGRFHAPSSLTEGGGWSNTTGRSIGNFAWTQSTNVCSNEICWEKVAPIREGYEDGPFNDGAGSLQSNISIIGIGPDVIDYRNPELSQPAIRFGRVALDSAGTTTNAILNIPLRVEFWDGERFIVNTPDSGMNSIAGESNESDNNVVWVETGATAENLSLGGGGVVTNGESNSITVEHTSDVRQQVQIWLELDGTSNEYPWLRYHWDHSTTTEQDPSTVATFGIYRGNDRVIFRGEAGLIGQ